MNFSLPLLALLMANRLGDSASDSGRAALLAMMIRPPMMGLLIAIMVARQKANTNTVVSNTTASKAARAGAKLVNQIITKPDRSFFPSFIGLTRKEAAHQAKQLGLSVTLQDAPGATGKDMVVGQDPNPGTDWPRSITAVTLFLG